MVLSHRSRQQAQLLVSPGRERQERARRTAGFVAGFILCSRIIRAANAFDDLVGASIETSRTIAALEWLRLDTATEYDPRVVEALAEVAGRRHRSRR